MKKIIFACMLTLGVASCASVNQSNPPTDGNSESNANSEKSQFIGVWNWTNTDGGFGNTIHDTPTTKGKTIQLTLMKNQKFTLIENGTNKASGTYDIRLHRSIYTGEMDNFITFSNDFTNGIISLNDSKKMTIADNHPDGTAMTFSKN